MANPTIKKLATNIRVLLLLFCLVLALTSIRPQFDTHGAAIRTVIKDSAAFESGLASPKETAMPTSREVVLAVNNQPISTVDDYNRIVSDLGYNETVTIETDQGFYSLYSRPKLNITVVGEENKTFDETKEVDVNGTLVNQTMTVTRLVNITNEEVIGVEDLGLRVYEVPATNLIKGLDLQGGTRVLLEPDEEISTDDMGLLIESLKQRLNVYGLSDVIVREARDLSGNQFILVEIAGANEDEVRELISKQGKFEAKVANDTVFRGGNDVTYVCRSTSCAGINPNSPCQGSPGQGYLCGFFFQISLSPEAAQRQADVTARYPIKDAASDHPVLSEPLTLLLDDEEVDTLQIAADLRGRAVTDIQITGSGNGASQDVAIADALKNMKRLQTILITGSLPVKLNVVQTKNISPALGEEFLQNAILLGLLSILAVVLVVFIRYRKLSISVPMFLCMVSEVALILGFAALLRWNLDLTAIAGIIIAVGTGVDDQIVIADEVLEGAQVVMNWKEKVKRAFGIIFTAWVTTMVAMGPLLFAGAGLLRGFALTTMAGITFGVLITRPAYAKAVEILLNK